MKQVMCNHVGGNIVDTLTYTNLCLSMLTNATVHESSTLTFLHASYYQEREHEYSSELGANFGLHFPVPQNNESSGGVCRVRYDLSGHGV
jgi:23S rRNA U2552 (ribose-2'-O)-methylase RlmE/FtsJ